ncbi:MAG TPA: aldehyde dehydrogenase family protein, partial [Candidatus Thermoplasmatota archaeon]|nr:aldehyde dehydrogenase family protein [Candidatus Thermoplasmatota archaeon]
KGASQALVLAREGPAWLADEAILLEQGHARVRCAPRGVAAAITPWNFPLWQPLRSLMPALLAGNTCALKPAPQGTLTALLLRRCFEEAQLPRGVLRVLTGGAATGEALVRAPLDAIAFTGSRAAGQRVAAAAAEGLKHAVLELGGSDPFLVLADADLDLAVRLAMEGRFRNAGQICISAKRFFVEEPLFDAFADRITAAAQALVVGDPAEPATQMGPLVSAAQRDLLHAQVQASVAQGARVRCGGAALPRKGWFYAPTVLDGVTDAMPVMTEETFGPVAPLVAVRDASEAVQRANATPFGLGASVVAGDVERARRIAAQLEAGTVAINGLVHTDARVPFGGVKGSGVGRELGRDGLRAWTDLRVVVSSLQGLVASSQPQQEP